MIRKKAPDEELKTVIDSIESQATAHNVDDPLVTSTDVFVTAICFIGSKSLSHFLSCIERCKDRLLSIGPQSSAARRQIITSVMDYWTDNPGIGVNIIDKLLNYTILTPMSVIEWTIRDHVDRGRILAKHYIYEMVATTTWKVTNRVRQVLAATRHPGLPEDQVQMLEETLTRERKDMSDMFAVIDDALVSIASGSSDEQMDNGYGDTTEERLARSWGTRWARVFKRKNAVEEVFIREVLATQPEEGSIEDTMKVEENGNGTVEDVIS